jgi:hypothetical protein
LLFVCLFGFVYFYFISVVFPFLVFGRFVTRGVQKVHLGSSQKNAPPPPPPAPPFTPEACSYCGTKGEVALSFLALQLFDPTRHTRIHHRTMAPKKGYGCTFAPLLARCWRAAGSNRLDAPPSFF